MKRKTRRVLFYGLFALFLVLGTAITLYAEGWRIDLATFKTSRVGAIFVESFPHNADITLNGKPEKNKTGFLSPGTLISNLFPKNYTLSLSAPGYDDWTENAMVAPTLVTEMKYAVLVPANASSAAPTKNVTGFFEAGGNVITENAAGAIALASSTIAHGTMVSHSSDFTTFVTKSAGGIYSAYDLTAGTSTSLTALLNKNSVPESSITAVTVNPHNGANVFVETHSRFYTIDLAAGTSGGTISSFAAAQPGGTLESPLAISSSWLAWAEYRSASDTSRITVYDPFSGDTIDSSLTIPGRIASLQWIRSTLLGVLGTNGEFYRYDIPSETLTKMADDVKSFYASADGSTIATLEDRSVEVFSLTLPANQGGYYRFNLPDMGSVESLVWYRDNTHLFVTYPAHVNFLDLADLSLRNFTEVSAVSSGIPPVYDMQENTLYLVDQGGKLIRFSFPS